MNNAVVSVTNFFAENVFVREIGFLGALICAIFIVIALAVILISKTKKIYRKALRVLSLAAIIFLPFLGLGLGDITAIFCTSGTSSILYMIYLKKCFDKKRG